MKVGQPRAEGKTFAKLELTRAMQWEETCRKKKHDTK